MWIRIACLSILIGSYRTCREDIADVIVGICDILCLSSVVPRYGIAIVGTCQAIPWVILVVDTFAKGFDSPFCDGIDIANSIILITRIKEFCPILQRDF